MPNLSDIGIRGLVIADGEDYWFVTESEWREKFALTKAPESGGRTSVQTLVDLKVALAKLSNTVFVNLDALANLGESDLDPAEAAPKDPKADVLDTDGILLHEKNQYYLVPLSELHPLEENAEGDAGVLVSRGALVASIPANDIPTGTFCVLVNWSGLQQA